MPEAAGVRRSDAPLEARVTIGSHVVVIERTRSGGIVTLRGADGSVPLEIEITSAGPLLRLRSGLAIAVEGPMSFAAETVSIHADRELALSSGGGIELRAAGDLCAEADAHAITARLGDVAVQANDDVSLRGERIKLNC